MSAAALISFSEPAGAAMYPLAQKKIGLNAVDTTARKALVGSTTLGTGTVISDLSSSVRSGHRLMTIVQSPASQPAQPALSAVGFTSFFNVPVGGLIFKGGVEEFNRSYEEGDVLGQIRGLARCALGTCFILGGLLFIPLRVLSVIANGTSNFSTVINWLGTIGGMFFGGASFCVLISGSINLYRQCQLPDNTEKIVFAALTVVLATLSVGAFIVGNICTAGLPLLISAIISVVVGAGWLGVDGYQLIQAFQKGEEGHYDKLYTLLLGIICFAAIAVGLFLSFSTPLGIVIGVLGIVWMALILNNLRHQPPPLSK